MAVQYTNRVGKTYYLREGQTKTGKPRYFFSSKSDGKGSPVEAIPENFEIYEHPENAQVFLRKKRPQLITDLEKRLVEKHTGKLKRDRRYRVDCKDEYITIYESNVNVGNMKGILGDLLHQTPLRAGFSIDDALDSIVKVADRQYTAVMRFRLVDEDRRRFAAERFCFRGSIDDWIQIGGPDRLEKLVKRYVKYLGTDDFYEIVGF